MAIKIYKPTSPGRRDMSGSTFEEITKSKPEKSLLVSQSNRAGRNAQGKLTVRHHGGGSRQHYRIIDFKRDKVGIPARVDAIEYDPNRSANIALLVYADGEKRYILAPLNLTVGTRVVSGPEAEVRVGNALQIRDIPTGTYIHNVEMEPGKGGQMARSAGVGAQLVAKEGNYGQVRLPSGEVHLLRVECMATIGQIGNVDHSNIRLGKAGVSRWKGLRPTVRGAVMNPRDHPHGGGEARAPIGGHPQTKWGKPAMGNKTRRRKSTQALIVRSRRQQ